MIHGAPVFEIDWEQKLGIDECPHLFTVLQVREYPGGPVVEVLKCERCGCPRCWRHSPYGDHSQCTERLHHRSLHLYDDGSFEPLGGLL